MVNIGYISMVTILMMLAKMVTLGLLKIKVFWNKRYDIIIYLHDATNKVLSRDSIISYMWPYDQRLVTLAFHNHNFIWIWPEETLFWEIGLIPIQWFGPGTNYGVEILH